MDQVCNQSTPEPAPLSMPINPFVFLSKKKGVKKYGLRRAVFFSLILITTAFNIAILNTSFASVNNPWLTGCILALFGILNFNLSLSFWTVIIGFFIHLFGKDTKMLPLSKMPIPLSKKTKPTALIMPIFNVDTHRTFAGLHAMYQEILNAGAEKTFELFILSDTQDSKLQLQEQTLWSNMCTHFNAQNKIFYRHREHNIGRKSGNIADFCQNWGGRYDYMVILDADSLMSTELLLNLTKTIHAHPEIGILQTTMMPVNAKSLFGRMMQFASCIQGKFFAAGTAFWQLSQAPYWGHNAIIRMNAFVAHARLPELPGNPPLGGEILSHDLVEATLLRETDWDVWFLYDTPGSFEELPPDILDYAKRDRRWCQGNLQHTRFLFTKNLSRMSRIYFYLGTLMYLAAPLWLCYFIVTTITVYHWQLSVLAFGQIPIFILLFFPRALSLVSILFEKKQVALFGGYLALITSAFLELILSILLAPIWMLYHTKFIAAILLGFDIGWPSKNPSMDGLGLKDAISAHGWLTLTGLVMLFILYIYIPQSLVWFLPLLLGPLLAIPLSMLLSSTKWGALAKKYKLFYTPEESNPSELLRIFEQEMLKP